MTLDSGALAVLLARLSGIADEMGLVLRRAAYSPNIKERADCSAAVFTPAGELLAQAEHIPVHLGAMPASVRAVIDAFGPSVITAGAGADGGPDRRADGGPDRRADGGADLQFVVNDPFAGGTHLNDVTVVAPVLDRGRLLGWVANRAHHADVGGTAPGSMPADAVDIAEEGIRLAPQRLTAEVRDAFVAASRTPWERAGDLDAQIGANRVGAARFLEVRDAPFAEVLDYGERRMRAALAALPDGTVVARDQLDSTGMSGVNRTPAPVVVTVRVVGDTITFDFTGSAPQRPGNVNAVEAVTRSAVAFALRTATDPTIPANGGALRPVRVVAPAGTIVAATAPVAVGAGNVEVSQRVADVCLAALRSFVPDRIGGAHQGTMNNVLIGNDRFVYYETIGGGQGARPGRSGMSGIHTAMTNTRDTPVEALERAYPLRVLRYGLVAGSGGAGEWRGGDGIVKEYELLEPATVSLIAERRASSPPGVDGGGDGAVGQNWLLPGGDEARAQRLADKVTVALGAGDVIRVITPGGGGCGPVRAR